MVCRISSTSGHGRCGSIGSLPASLVGWVLTADCCAPVQGLRVLLRGLHLRLPLQGFVPNHRRADVGAAGQLVPRLLVLPAALPVPRAPDRGPVLRCPAALLAASAAAVVRLRAG